MKAYLGILAFALANIAAADAYGQMIIDGERRILLPNVKPLTAIGRFENKFGHATAWVISKCHALTVEHALFDKENPSKEPELAGIFRAYDGRIWPVEVVARLDQTKGEFRDVAMLRFRPGVDIEKQLGKLELDTSRPPEEIAKEGGNYCAAGYSIDREKFGKKATMDPAVRILNTERGAFEDSGSRWIYLLRANSAPGASGGPVFRCPLDSKTGKPDYSNPVVVAMLSTASTRRGTAVTTSEEIPWSSLPGAISTRAWMTWPAKARDQFPCK